VDPIRRANKGKVKVTWVTALPMRQWRSRRREELAIGDSRRPPADGLDAGLMSAGDEVYGRGPRNCGSSCAAGTGATCCEVRRGRGARCLFLNPVLNIARHWRLTAVGQSHDSCEDALVRACDGARGSWRSAPRQKAVKGTAEYAGVDRHEVIPSLHELSPSPEDRRDGLSLLLRAPRPAWAKARLVRAAGLRWPVEVGHAGTVKLFRFLTVAFPSLVSWAGAAKLGAGVVAGRWRRRWRSSRSGSSSV